MNNIRFFLFFCLIHSTSACGTGGNEKANQKTDLSTKEQTLAAGQKIYQTYCVVCHQVNGDGIEQLYPPLGGTDWVTGDKERLISVLLHGLQKPIVVKGKEYNNMMPPHNFLDDQNIAAVLTYIRSSFGNSASEITPNEVAEVRSKNKN